MPASASIKLAIEAALRASNEGFQSMEESAPVFDQSMTAAAASKHMAGTLLKAYKSGAGTEYWYVPMRADAVSRTAQGEYKMSIEKTGNDNAGTMTKLVDLQGGEWVVTHAVRAILTSARGLSGALAALSVTGLPATLVPKAGAQLTHLVMTVGGAAAELTVEAALAAAKLEWEPWAGCTAKAALSPVGNSMPAVNTARAKAVSLAAIAGSDNYRAQAAAQALGIASATAPTTVGNVAAMIAGWGDYPDAAEAVAIVLAIDPQASSRCARAHPSTTALISTMRDELAVLTSEQISEVTKLSAELQKLGLTASGMHIGTWLQKLLPTLPATRPMGVILAPQPPLGMATATSACQAEAARRVAGYTGLSDATKATMVAALTAQLLGEGWGAAAVAAATVGLDPLRIVGAERLSPAQVFSEISKAINKTTAEVVATVSGARGAAGDERCAIFMTDERVAERAADDLHFMAERSGTRFEAQPVSWSEAAQRVGDIIAAFIRTRKTADDGPPPETAAARLARRISSGGDDERREVARIYDAKGSAKGMSAAATILNPLTTDSFARKEAMATKEADEFKEVHRLCSHEGSEGRGCESHILSDGKSTGSMANKGEVPPSVVAARERLVSLIEDTTESFMGESLTGEAAGEEVAQFSSSVVTANLSTTKVVKLLGARKDTKSTLGGRTVMSGSKFGSMTGPTWQEDFVTAMQRLGQLLYVIYATACGYPKGGRGMDFGLADFARATCGAMSSARCVEIFDHLFTRAAGMARKRRQRVDAAPLDWAEVVEEAENLKFGQLVGQQEAEETTRRIIAETAPGGSGSGGRKSPRRDDATDEGAAGDERKRGKRGGKVEAGKAAKREAAETDRAPRSGAAPESKVETRSTTAPAEAATVVAKAEDITAALEALDLNKADFVVKNYATGEVKEETAAHLFNRGVRLSFPEMKGSDAPCFFFWMGKKGCKAASAGKVCENCKRAAKLGAKAVRPPTELMEAIASKANESTKALLK